MDGNTHNSPCTHSLSQCYAVGGWSGLCGLSWISVSTLAGPHSACRRLAASAPGTGCRAARWPTSPELMPSSWRHPGWSHFMQLWLGPDSLRPPPHLPPPLLCGSLGSHKQPRCVPSVELHWESASVASYIFTIREDVDVLYFWGFCKSEKRMSVGSDARI